MRFASIIAFAALPALVSADWHHRHRYRQPAGWFGNGHGRVVERQGIIESIISDVFNPGGGTSTTTSVPRPSTPIQTPTSSAPPQSTTERPPTSSNPPSSVKPSSSAPPSPSSETSQAPEPTPTTETPMTTQEQSTTYTSESLSSSASLSVKFVTQTVNGQVVTEVATPTPKESGGGGGIGTGAIVGIAVGAGVVVIAIVAVIIMLARRGRSSTDDDVIRWPELNHHGDTEVQHALPVHQSDKHGLGDRRMSLGSELDEPQYLQSENEYPQQGGLGGSTFGAAADFNNYDNEKFNYAPTSPQHRTVSPYGYDEDNYTSFPPPVQPQPSPVHGVRPDWATDGSFSDGHNGYATMHRDNSPPMAGVGSYFTSSQHSPPPMAGVGSGYPPQQPHY
ncbi:hypothetical protein CcaverHIS002_0606160 [Cutaneotrichosporon cavernicola]|uniref:Mid2 domain-containing protein n=1 Tax=Cutaneotrichosporon cavernicola TaxID=279322 RepID=A0AA48L8V1_9TREE|nr:uncharacterized protein CcaverHIS019_0605620 [Cutaneotrichosporon cavernicola]BEI86329.1 hypothetical protein CcaverHIS002_0606160 [Cutaneotrichosporon cavernicola]BEI94103.1 hypothetical protein CcaverHIS019_0605620 [Cutaneotrichosporon cavernicola]BEJ01882.1 hypothetical protein CcaverHIS631_0605640 [Cutaneotrichosporon cavernicola]BEJ09647.1 hypothetical protein CcaverHIS641_0605620 [Cutaneotrichosporon cavernicola]